MLLQLRVPQQEAAPQAANQWATLLEWEVYSPTSVNLLQVGITASHTSNILQIKTDIRLTFGIYQNACNWQISHNHFLIICVYSYETLANTKQNHFLKLSTVVGAHS